MANNRSATDQHICDYCNQTATRIHHDSGDLLCDSCADDQVSSPATDLSLIGPRTLAWYRPWS